VWMGWIAGRRDGKPRRGEAGLEGGERDERDLAARRLQLPHVVEGRGSMPQRGKGALKLKPTNRHGADSSASRRETVLDQSVAHTGDTPEV
jgi:hypothetical protein